MTTTTEVRERPILFTTDMVQAILDGEKSQTRRVAMHTVCGVRLARLAADPAPSLIDCPYGQPGDRLWVRETWQLLRLQRDWESGQVDGWEPWEGKVPATRPAGFVTAFATGYWGSDREERGFAWRPSIFMRRWASRLALEITGVRVERVRDISYDDCIAEGIKQRWTCINPAIGSYAHDNDVEHDYRLLWDALNASRGYGWDVNPYVWCIEFRKVCP